jgi:hypothetical protein
LKKQNHSDDCRKGIIGETKNYVDRPNEKRFTKQSWEEWAQMQEEHLWEDREEQTLS